jgi:hypothetical protein
MNIMFLDIDGVVCTLRSQYAYGERVLMEAWDITCCQMLRRLCEANDYKIVCSSTWRNNRRTGAYFATFGLIQLLHKDWRTPFLTGIRGNEIKKWLDDHSNTKNYVIIDDDKDFLEEQKIRLIHVDDNYNGFSVKNFDEADKLMGGNYMSYIKRNYRKEGDQINWDIYDKSKQIKQSKFIK